MGGLEFLKQLIMRYEPWKYEECKKCGSSYQVLEGCENCKKIERLKGVECPCCKSKNVDEGSVNQNNGFYGGCASWSIFNYLYCKECGVMFKKVKEDKDEI